MITVRRAGIGVIVAAALVACASDDDGQAGENGPVPTTVAPQTVSSEEEHSAETTLLPTESTILDPELRRELLEMMAEDQAEQTGQVSTNNYTARTERLAEILDEHGWPSHDLVGEDGSTAAWVIAQHADLDLELQQRALELLRAAAAIGQASGGDLAYLEDRVAVATGHPQRYGTQVGCGEDRTPVTAAPLADAATVDERRAEAGLPSLAEYIAEMTVVCADAG